MRTLLSGYARRRDYIDQGALESELVLVANMMSGRERSPAAYVGASLEIDVSQIVRPERFITPEVSGLAVPSMTTMGDKVQGRWLLYLRWADGKRERRPMAPALDLPDGRRLWIHPEPSEPTPNMKPGWSAAARQRWMEGEPAPTRRNCSRRWRRCSPIHRPAGGACAGRDGDGGLLGDVDLLLQAWDCGALSVRRRSPRVGKVSAIRDVVAAGLSAAIVVEHDRRGAVPNPSHPRRLFAVGRSRAIEEHARPGDGGNPFDAVGRLQEAAARRPGWNPSGDSGFKTVSFDVFGPKALACIAGLPPALASRAIPVTMFRSPPGSEKPRRRIDADPEGWQRLRDELHALALEHGPTWLELPERTDVCPAMSGRDYELWQPLLALASWIESHGARGLLKLLQEHALATIDAGRDDATPDADETLLRILADEIRTGMVPTPGDILAKAQAVDAAGFKTWKARGVSEHLKRYGATTTRAAGERSTG